MSTVELTADNFSDVVSANDVVLVDFWASWCGPCQRFGPVFEAAAAKHPGVVFGKVDTEAQPELAAAFEIRSIPTLMALRQQVILFAQSGALPASALDELLSQVVALDMDEVRAQLAAQAEAG
jgi:thioredoxin 1